MNAMQYKITLPNDYDMNIIKERIYKNGSKTDGFTDLLLKAYLVIDTKVKKQYSPLYIWQGNIGMNKFIFDGFYDNILSSFGWQKINIAIPFIINISNSIKDSRYVLEIGHNIAETDKMKKPTFSKSFDNSLGSLLLYNPDKWKYVEFHFFENKPTNQLGCSQIYQIFHISTQ
ncbi:DUF4865 family protein [Breznakia pachnodae]|uniref:DUF4865 domain-containing protein n=1 Tax=Breznakia pachnodae TaxID=265178 RepID=A0ABU0E716_9FIRM|nr:DUF4865 family protein [Breznakia pachnodae]MDQ0362697.1 hypothetical protein [Breznakia pachnodae]